MLTNGHWKFFLLTEAHLILCYPLLTENDGQVDHWACNWIAKFGGDDDDDDFFTWAT